MTKKDRMVEFIEETGETTVEVLAYEFEVSEETVKRYLRDIKKEEPVSVVDGNVYWQAELESSDSDWDDDDYDDDDEWEDEWEDEGVDEQFVQSVLNYLNELGKPVKLVDIAEEFGEDPSSMQEELEGHCDILFGKHTTWLANFPGNESYVEWKGDVFERVHFRNWQEMPQEQVMNTSWEK